MDRVLKESASAFATRSFYGMSPRPLAAWFTCLMLKLLNERYTICAMHVLVILAAIRACNPRLKGWKRLLFFVSGLAACNMHASLSGEKISLFFVLQHMHFLCVRARWKAATMFALAVACDSRALFLCLPMLVSEYGFAFDQLCDRSLHPAAAALAIAGTFLRVIYIPAILILAAVLDLRIRNTHSLQARAYSLEFQSTLSGYNIYGGTAPLGSTDRVVMDRSKVVLLNRHHRMFVHVSGEENGGVARQIHGSSVAFSVFELVKVHPADETESGADEGWKIVDGDSVKLKIDGEDQYLTTSYEEGGEKFFAVSLGEPSEDGRDVWIVHCSGGLHARETVFRLSHSTTGLYLGCRSIEGGCDLHASVYSRHILRDFYIASNEVNEYLKNELKVAGADARVTHFPQQKLPTSVYEYLMKPRLSNRQRLDILSAAVGVSSLIFLYVYYVVNARRGLSLPNGSWLGLHALMYVSVLASGLVAKTGQFVQRSTAVLLTCLVAQSVLNTRHSEDTKDQ